MTQESSPQKLVETLLQSLDPSAIADESLRRTVSILLNLMRAITSRNQRITVRKSKIKIRKQSPERRTRQTRGQS
jgi:hypothetical protein